MAERKEFIGIEDNECTFIGKVLEDPQIMEGFAFLKLRCTTGEMQENGQFVDTPMMVPILAQSPGVVKTIQNHVRAGRKLKVNAYYKAWTDESGAPQHAFMAKSLKLGSKPYDGPKQDQSKPSVPPANLG